MSKQYTRRRNRARQARRERSKRRRDKLEFYGKCSNCGKGARPWSTEKRPVLVRRIAGAQVCFDCAKHLPGHLLRKVFPMVRDPKLGDFLRDHNVVSTTAVDRPDPPEMEKTWREKIAEKLRSLSRIFRRK